MLYLIEDNTKRIALLIEYNGKNLVGWQKQNNGNSVQNSIENASQVLFKKMCSVQAAGRTDAGVHALGQVAHIDIPIENEFSKKNNFYLVSAFNSLLVKTNIRIISIQDTPFEFNARFSAKKRIYLYKFLCRSASPALMKHQVWHIRKKIDLEAMKLASKYLIGSHDFTSFRSKSCQAKSAFKTLDNINFKVVDDLLIMKVEAKSFLQNQVRIIAGSLIRVGTGAWKPMMIKKILKSKSRDLAGETAPSDGLYLKKIIYPKRLINPIWPIHMDN